MMLRDTYCYFKRDLLKWLRGRIFIVTSLIMPAVWLVFVGLALPTRFTDNYIGFITPGILVMTVLFNSLQGGTLLIFDKILGFLNKFMALPAPRESILLGKIGFITFRGLLQSTIILVMAVLLGVQLPGPVELFYIYLALAVFGVLVSAVACTIALAVDDHDGYSAFNSLVSMPLFFASSALMPYSEMPFWLRTIATLNPVSHAIDTTRAAFTGTIALSGMLVIAVLAVAVLGICIYRFRKATL